MAGVAPMGCFPIVIDLFSSNPFQTRDCIDSFSAVAVNYNTRLQEELRSIQSSTAESNTVLAYVDIYNPIIKMVKKPNKYGEFFFLYPLSC